MEKQKPHAGKTRIAKKKYDAISVIYDFMEWPVEKFLYKGWREHLMERLQGPVVLEIGIGTGKNIPYYPADLNITGIDLSSGMLKHAKRVLEQEGNENVTLKEMDAQDMDFQDETFDEVLVTFVFCSVPYPVLGLKEALRVTKPGGKIHLMEHMRADNAVLAPLMKILDPPIHFFSGVHIARKTVDNVAYAGWDIQKAERLDSNGIFRMIEAKKPHS